MSDSIIDSSQRGHDRRKKPRIYVPFRAIVRGVNSQGEEFSVDTVLDNMSGDGLYMRMMPLVKKGGRLSIEIGLTTPSDEDPEPSRTMVEGVVLRSEMKAGGVCGVAVKFDRVRFG